jgi:O-antigen/teichoic acid export membrane protein
MANDFSNTTKYHGEMTQTQILINSLSLLGNRAIQGVSTFALTTVIARNLGAEQLGQYILAIGYYVIFVTFFGLGLRTLFTRELAKASERTSVYLVSGSLLQLFLSIIAYLLLVTVVVLMPYSDRTSMICYIMGLSVIPYALSNITEAIFQAQERMHLIAISTSPIYILRTGAMIWVVLHLDNAIEYVAAIMVLSEVAILVWQWLLLMRTIEPKWQIDFSFIIDSFQAAKTLFAIDGVGIIAGKLDMLLISLLGGEILIGIYGAIRQLVQPFEIIGNSLCSAIFPRMSNAVILGKHEQRKRIEFFIDILFCISLPLIPMMFFFYGEQILVSLYKNPEFARGEIPLQITAIPVILFPLMRLSNYLLIANNLEKYNLIEVIIITILGSSIGAYLISNYQLIGAALMSAVMSICSCGIYIYVIHTRLFKIRFFKVLRRPVIITGLMLCLLLVLQQFHFSLLLNLSISIGFYGAIAASMLIRQLGGIAALGQFITKSP